MHKIVSQLARVLLRDITINELGADECADMAALAKQGKASDFGNTVLAIGRMHRVKAMEMRGQVAALRDREISGCSPAS